MGLNNVDRRAEEELASLLFLSICDFVTSFDICRQNGASNRFCVFLKQNLRVRVNKGPNAKRFYCERYQISTVEPENQSLCQNQSLSFSSSLGFTDVGFSCLGEKEWKESELG